MPTAEVKHKPKVCTQCGKVETYNWKRHWKRKHPGLEVIELVLGETPI